MRALDPSRVARVLPRATGKVPPAPRSRRRRYPLPTVVTSAAAAALVLGLLAFLLGHHVPPFALFLGWCLVTGLLATAPLAARKTAAAWLCGIFGALIVLEVVSHLHGSAGLTIESGSARGPGFFAPDDVRGFAAPRRASLYRARVETAGRVPLYDVIYTIGANGLRVTPPALVDGRETWFFGCSLAFGTGLPDEETLPWLYTERTGKPAVNFAFPGYGPHQFLRMLETEFPARVGAGVPERVIYTLLPTHINSAAGLATWDRSGPLYEVVGNSVGHVGPFRGPVAAWADRVALTSAFYREIVRPSIFRRDATSVTLTVQILARADQLLRTQHRVSLQVLLWDAYPRQTARERSDIDALELGLAERNIQVRRISGVLPPAASDRYFLPGDPHPTGAANAVVADWLTRAR